MTKEQKEELKAIQAEREAELFSEYWGKGMSVLDEFAQIKIAEERSRVIQLWELEMLCKCEDAMRHLLSRIKGEANG